MERVLVRWFVCKYYTMTKDLTVTVAEFMKEEYAREYFNWQKRRLVAENNKRLTPRGYVWQLCKKTESYMTGEYSLEWFD